MDHGMAQARSAAHIKGRSATLVRCSVDTANFQNGAADVAFRRDMGLDFSVQNGHYLLHNAAGSRMRLRCGMPSI